MNISNTLREMANTMRYSKKSDRTEFKLYLKLVALGVGVVGGVAFVIHMVSAIVSFYLAPKSIIDILMSVV